MTELKKGKDEAKKEKGLKANMLKNIRTTRVFEGFEAPGGQAGPKIAPKWTKMRSGSELDGIFGHLRKSWRSSSI